MQFVLLDFLHHPFSPSLSSNLSLPCVCVCVFFRISLLLPQPQPGTAPVLGRNPTPPLLINLPTDCQELLAVHRRGGGGGREACLQQLSNKLTTIKTLMQHSITEQRLDCPHFVWHAWWCNSQSRACCWHFILTGNLGILPTPAAKKQQVWGSTGLPVKKPPQKMHADKFIQQVEFLSRVKYK